MWRDLADYWREQGNECTRAKAEETSEEEEYERAASEKPDYAQEAEGEGDGVEEI